MFEELIEQLIQYFSKDPYKDDFARAKEIYTKIVGTVVEEHAYFDTWISGFFEWYLIDYKMEKFGVPPMFLYQKIFADGMEKNGLELLREVEKCELELLEIQSVSRQKIKCLNVFQKQTFEFYSHENTALLQKNDFLITRILPSVKRAQSFGVVWHLSSEVAPIVLKKVEKVKTPLDQEMFIYELLKKKTHSEIYSHVPLEQIFGWKTNSEFQLKPTIVGGR